MPYYLEICLAITIDDQTKPFSQPIHLHFRNFLGCGSKKVLTGGRVCAMMVCGNRPPLTVKLESNMKRIYIREEVCLGCRLCEVYCQVRHSSSKDLIKAFKLESPRPLPGLWVEECRPVSFPVQCRHCPEPPCVYACLTGALHQAADSGAVTVDAGRCVGCWTCILVCPLGAIRQDIHRARIAKCDLCLSEDTPVCVTICPNEALVYAESESSVEPTLGAKVASK